MAQPSGSGAAFAAGGWYEKIEATTAGLPPCARQVSAVDYRSEECFRFLCRKKMAPPTIDIPMSINASELEMTEVDVPTAITPTITPAIETNNRIIRSPSHISRFGYRPLFRMSKLLANIAPLQILWNINEMGLLFRGGRHKIVREAQHCTNTTFMDVSCGKCRAFAVQRRCYRRMHPMPRWEVR